MHGILNSLSVTLHDGKSDFHPRTEFNFLGFRVALRPPAHIALQPAAARLLGTALRTVPYMAPTHRERLAGYLAFVLRTLRMPTGLVSTVLFQPDLAPTLAPVVERAAPLTLPPQIDVVLASDPSTFGWGLAFPHGSYSHASALGEVSIYLAEMAAALWGLATARAAGAQHPLLATDNTAVAHNLARRRIPLVMLPYFIHRIGQLPFHICYVPTHFNPADGPSRLTTDGSPSSGRRANCLPASWSPVSWVQTVRGDRPAGHPTDWQPP